MAYKALTGHTLDAQDLKADGASAQKIGNSAVGEKALYLPGRLFARKNYLPLASIERAFLRLMTGSRGKVNFRQPLLVLQVDGKELCYIYREEQTVRDLLAALESRGVATGKPKAPKPN